jgi:transposase
VVILDSQSLKTTERGGTRGFDGHKRVKGRKRHLLVDTLGMVVARWVEAANVSDRRVGARLLAGLQSGFPWIRTVMADAGYKSRKLACELKRRHGWRLHITKRRQRAFKVVGLTWIVERTFAWLARNRRLSKDYELKVQTSEAFIDLAAIRLMLKRLGPEIKLLKHPLRHSEASNPETNVDLRETARLFLLFGKSAAMLLQPVFGEDPGPGQVCRGVRGPATYWAPAESIRPKAVFQFPEVVTSSPHRGLEYLEARFGFGLFRSHLLDILKGCIQLPLDQIQMRFVRDSFVLWLLRHACISP